MPSYIQFQAVSYQQMLQYCEQISPFECCGLLVSSEMDNKQIDIILPIKNDHPDPLHHFSFDPNEWINAYYFIIKNQLLLVGIYHSHPHSAPLPSLEDINTISNVLSSDALYCIVGLQTKNSPLVSMYRVTSDYGLEDYPLIVT